MKSFIYFTIIFLMFFLGFSLVKAQEQNSFKTHVGIGVSVFSINDLLQFIVSQGAGQTTSLYLTIDSSPGFRIEPEFGYSVYNIERKDNGYSSESTLKILRLGTGLFAKNSKNNQYHIYYGIRLGYLYNSEESKYRYDFNSGTDKESSSGLYLAPTVGGEYFFSDFFCMGGETQIMYSSSEYDDSNDPNEEMTISSLSIRAVILVHYYF